MTWSERIKSAWKTFISEALPLYAWSLIFLVGSSVLLIATIIGAMLRLRLTFPEAFSRPISPGMPIPGIPPALSINPLTDRFALFLQNLFGNFDGRMTDSSMLINIVISITVTVFLIIIGSWVIGALFYAGLFNLTAKAYNAKVTFRDFRLDGFARIFGWQGILLLIKLAIFFIGFLGIISWQYSRSMLITFIVGYSLVLIIIWFYLAPWLASSSIYLLAHRKEGFSAAFKGSWKFFQRHRGALWGYIGTVFLIQIALQIINYYSPYAGGLIILLTSPFMAVLAIVWVLTLEDEEH